MKRFRKVVLWSAIVVGCVVLLGLAASSFFFWRLGGILEARLHELRAAGEPVRITDLRRDRIPPDSNAETHLRRVDADLTSIEKELNALYPRAGYPRSVPTPDESEKLARIFDAHPGLIPTLQTASQALDDDPDLDTTLPCPAFIQAVMDRSGGHRSVYRILRTRSQLLMAQGHPDEAVRTQLLLLRLIRQWRHDPMLIAFLVRGAGEISAMETIGRVLQSATVTPETRAAIDAELDRHDTSDAFAHALRTERTFSLETTRTMPGAGFWPLRLFQQELALQLLDLYDRYLKDAPRPYLAVAAAPPRAPRPKLSFNPYNSLVTLLEPSLLSALETADRVRAMDRSLRILNALQTKSTGEAQPVPPLTDLGLPAEAIVDPYDGHPIRVKAAPRGWTVYSIGRNGVDDGGRLDNAADIGVAAE